MTWKYTPIAAHAMRAGMIHDGEKPIACVSQTRRNDEEIDAIGRLIEQAPKLYELVRTVFECGAMDRDEAQAVLQAVGHRPKVAA